jgi:hypothetical protein
MDIYKHQLPAGLSYALKPSILAAALQAGGIQTATSLFQWRNGWSDSGVLFQADFYPHGRSNRDQNEALDVRTHAVPSSLRAEARAFIETSVLPTFINWIASLERLPTGSTVRREEQTFVRFWHPHEDDGA